MNNVDGTIEIADIINSDSKYSQRGDRDRDRDRDRMWMSKR